MILNRRGFLGSAGAALTAARTSKAPKGMVLIPAGTAIVGAGIEEIAALAAQYRIHPSWLSNEKPRRQVALASFYIDRFPVTIAEFVRFVEAAKYDWPIPGQARDSLDRGGRLPVTGVSAADAKAYAAWAGKRLPSEAEWEFAARGPDGRIYPWGNSWDPTRCNNNSERVPNGRDISAVGAYPSGASQFGVEDLAGNVCEWTGTAYSKQSQVVKGGFWKQHQPYRFRASYRGMSQLSGNRQDYIGFRCVKDLEP